MVFDRSRVHKSVYYSFHRGSRASYHSHFEALHELANKYTRTYFRAKYKDLDPFARKSSQNSKLLVPLNCHDITEQNTLGQTWTHSDLRMKL